jgi:RNA polymerase sigma factor (sigma-70 family)
MDNSANGQVPLKQLFQQEFAKMVAVISKMFGLQHIEIAEDVVSDTFLLAAETWGTKGMPANPTAWLYTVAKHKTLYHFRRNKIFESKVIPELKVRGEKSEVVELDFSGENIRDSQLRMLFAVCNPAIASEAQIGLALRVLCGFGIDEIAEAFLSNKETINKRLFRAKEKLRTEKISMEMPPPAEIGGRLDNVLHVLYLLFNEGYYSRTKDSVLRKDLCLEAMRLALMLTADERTNLPETHALLALMCFHSSRLAAREAGEDTVVLYDDQDERLWDNALIRQGMHFLDLSATGNEISSYHLEAAIAYWHCRKEDTPEKWTEILGLYDQLLKINYSPSVALNRIYALYKARGQTPALAEALALGLENDHFYFVLLGELYKGLDDDLARANFEKAYALAKTQTEKQSILKKIGML